MKTLRNKFLHVGTVMGYMWCGWLCATNEPWYWIITVLMLTSIVHTAGVYFECLDSKGKGEGE